MIQITVYDTPITDSCDKRTKTFDFTYFNSSHLFTRFPYPDRKRSVNQNVPSPRREVYDNMRFPRNTLIICKRKCPTIQALSFAYKPPGSKNRTFEPTTLLLLMIQLFIHFSLLAKFPYSPDDSHRKNKPYSAKIPPANRRNTPEFAEAGKKIFIFI